ncbi:DUF6630 family protein [Dokdonella soli]|uniref:DUF6630 domain-containing protein n=1 Tax=Dokdonella soli TaxID=529810 RepID=A0ABP3TIS0_9GAMM
MPIEARLLAPLCSLLGCDAADLCEEVLLAARDPATYFERFEDDLLQRGIEEPERVSFWLALVDGLQRRGALWSFDWKDQADNLAAAMQMLAQRRGAELDWQPLASRGDEYGATSSFADAIQQILQPAELVAVWLDTESDEYPVCLIEARQVDKLRGLAQQLGQRIAVLDADS